ncbi:LLM class F420-dependent oxidoreductase [Actinomadura luteofluorescens]|uniref:LLM class F420-dependent oxidoreductase n=1 Tax=Actinomadura luteofluorescens TaxID=46163 RepID=UPI002164BC44|nr:LLM class F420-dependent oxidoreductase [Actinomadura glauciflava]MCR3743557.1 putative F420-dependent oxidoreductase, Rv3093c family [Actinomadura glauciflava]
MNAKLTVSLGLWQDRPAREALETAALADELRFPELWIGEMATYDAFALAVAVAARTSSIMLTPGPLPVAVRDPMMIAMAVASLADLTGRVAGVAIGTSSPHVVERWHGRERRDPPTALAESAEVVRHLLAGERAGFEGRTVRVQDYRLRLPAPRTPITIAAFGAAAVRAAARHADRMVVSLVTADSAGRLAARLRSESDAAGASAPPVAAWVPVAVDGGAQAREQVRRAVVGYLAAPGYAQMFEEAGFGDVVALARSRPHPSALLAAVPDELVHAVAALGGPEEVAARLASYAVDEIAVLPCCTDEDPAGEHTLRTLAAWTGP